MNRSPDALKRLPRRAACSIIRGYQAVLSPLIGPSCRFRPTCSAYALTSVERFGVIQGGWLAVRRIGRCHPWNPGGYDPVPETLRVSATHTTRSDAPGPSAGDPSR